MIRLILKTALLVLSIALLSGCDTGLSSVGVYIPKELDGYWNLTGTIVGREGSFPTQINQDFEIRNDRIYLEDSDDDWTGSYFSPYFRIDFERIVQDDEVVGCGQVLTTGAVTILVYLVESDEPSYDASAVGLFETDSECDGISRIELEGTLVLTPK